MSWRQMLLVPNTFWGCNSDCVELPCPDEVVVGELPCPDEVVVGELPCPDEVVVGELPCPDEVVVGEVDGDVDEVGVGDGFLADVVAPSRRVTTMVEIPKLRDAAGGLTTTCFAPAVRVVAVRTLQVVAAHTR